MAFKVLIPQDVAQGIDEVLSGQHPTWPVNDPAKRR